ncbi:MAG: DEAD/DEAH box helicase family protein [Oscillospiraceae bacterium]|nr:DEAD/DEAH box helicase family protein [Oscillospiraceae bacterium]
MKEVSAVRDDFLRNHVDSKYWGMLLSTEKYYIGDSKEYLSSIVLDEDIGKLKFGEAAAIFAGTGSGKTTTLKGIIKLCSEQGKTVVFLTNRKACKIQFLCSYHNKKFLPEIVERISPPENIHILTYQEFVLNRKLHNLKNVVFLFDEIHSPVEDSTFSTYGQRVLDYIKSHLDDTIRIYLTGTDDEIIDYISSMERVSTANKRIELHVDENTDVDLLCRISDSSNSRIKIVYLMNNDWNYLDFKFYNPHDEEVLFDRIKRYNEEDIKCFVYVNDIEKVKKLQENLGDAIHVYSSEDKRAEITQIAYNESFDSDSLIATKVMENGVSLTDSDIKVVVAETWDFTEMIQVIGRIRVKRSNPQTITVYIPNYSISDIGIELSKIYFQLERARKLTRDPDSTMETNPSNPFVYYSASEKKLMVNKLGIERLERLNTFLKELKDEMCDNKYAFVQKVLNLFDNHDDITDQMFIGYDKEIAFSGSVKEDFEEFTKSDQGKEAYNKLKKTIVNANEETQGYKQVLKETMQVSTVNEVLKFAGIEKVLSPSREFFDVKESIDLEKEESNNDLL